MCSRLYILHVLHNALHNLVGIMWARHTLRMGGGLPQGNVLPPGGFPTAGWPYKLPVVTQAPLRRPVPGPGVGLVEVSERLPWVW